MMVGRELLEERGSAADRGKEEEGKKREGEEEAAEAGYLDEAARAIDLCLARSSRGAGAGACSCCGGGGWCCRT